MEQTEEIYKKIKEIDSEEIRDILKDIIIIDGAIVEEDNLKYKEKVYSDLENKYYTKLTELKYYLYQDKLEDKVEKYVDSPKKDINTMIGLLKLFLIRIAAFEIVDNKELKSMLSKVNEENSIKNIKQLYEKIDSILLNNI